MLADPRSCSAGKFFLEAIVLDEAELNLHPGKPDCGLTGDPGLHPSTADRKWLVLLTIGVGSILGAVDMSVANIVLPVVRREFVCSVATIEWAVTIYLLVVCGFLLSFGRLADLRGQKRLYMIGTVVFVLGSAACGAAWSATALIAARAFQGLGSSMIFACAPALLTLNFPSAQRGQALGLQAIMIYLGQMMGPALGGWLTDHFSWRAVFYINLPVGVMVLLLSTKFIPRDEPKPQVEPFDFAGGGLFLAAFIVLMLGLNQGYDRGWTSPSIQALLVGAVLLLAMFVFLEHRRAHPLLDLKLFREPQFAMSAASAVLNYISVYTITFLMPFYLIQGRGLTAGPRGSADHGAAGGDGHLGSDQRHSFRPVGHAPAFDGGNGDSGRRAADVVATATRHSSGIRGRGDGRVRTGHGNVHHAEQQRVDGRGAGAPARDRRRRAGHGALRGNDSGRGPGRGGLHYVSESAYADGAVRRDSRQLSGGVDFRIRGRTDLGGAQRRRRR